MGKGRKAFADPNSPLSEHQVWAILEPYWTELVSVFRHAGYPEPGKVARIQVDTTWRDSCRHFAGAAIDGSKLIVAPELADLPVPSIRGILAHEGGHFVDLGNPGRYWLRPLGSVNVRHGADVAVLWGGGSIKDDALVCFEKLPEKNLRKHLRDWSERGCDEVERVADVIAEIVIGQKIGYVGPPSCLIQTIGKGPSRPKGLR